MVTKFKIFEYNNADPYDEEDWNFKPYEVGDLLVAKKNIYKHYVAGREIYEPIFNKGGVYIIKYISNGKYFIQSKLVIPGMLLYNHDFSLYEMEKFFTRKNDN
jgi:hypothetical protein